ncbi:hypothetical protein [Pseudomonas sp. NPDC089406]|uniref:hypothetical protein n=1 Tax=Pseudomonas sp. NPDC089406 TaxID=3364463 RepID=UPI00385069B2
MKGTLQDWVEACDPLMEQALDALRCYHEAKAEGRPEPDVERLKAAAEGLFQEVNDLMQMAFHSPSGPLH